MSKKPSLSDSIPGIPLWIMTLFSLAAFPLRAATKAIPVLEPSANQVKVRTVAELVTALGKAVTGQTIMLADGVYDVSGVEPLRIRANGVALFGESRDPTKAVLKGQGFTSGNVDEEMVKVEASNITLAYLTMRDVRANGLKIQTGANDNLLVHNVHFIDICERAIKGPDAPVSKGGIVRYCLFEQKTPITTLIPNLRFDGDYIAGMDMMKIEGWRIHDNTFRNIRGRTGGGRAAIFLWNGCKNVTVERNLIIGCDRAVAMGNPSSANSDMVGGIIRNNFIVAGSDISIEICNSTQTTISHNTIWSANPAFNRTLSFYNGGSGNLLRNNLVMGRLNVQGGVIPDSAANLLVPSGTNVSAWFKDPAGGDLHLTPAATGAIDKGREVGTVPDDFDARLRDGKPDIGADEFENSSPVQPRQGKGSQSGAGTVISGLAGSGWSASWNSARFTAAGSRLPRDARLRPF